MQKSRPPARVAVSHVARGEQFSKAAAAAYVSSLRGMNARERHDHFLNNYVQFYGDGGRVSAPPVKTRTDEDCVAEQHRFLWDNDEASGSTSAGSALSWEQRLAKKYHDTLYKEYALADMSRYREGAVGLRWRTETEVFDGKGQFVCGAKGCNADAELASFEVNFAYDEGGGARKNALVKLRLCPGCAAKLNYRREQRRAADDARERERERERRSERKHELKKKRTPSQCKGPTIFRLETRAAR